MLTTSRGSTISEQKSGKDLIGGNCSFIGAYSNILMEEEKKNVPAPNKTPPQTKQI
jgi:hypothetical protein